MEPFGDLNDFEKIKLFAKMSKKFKFSFFCIKMQFLKFEQKYEKEWAQQFCKVKAGSEKCFKAIL